MAVSLRVPSDEREYRIVCKGVSAKEFVELQREIEAELCARTLRRNPFYPDFHAKTVHEIIVRIAPVMLIAAGYTGKKAIDKVFDILADIAKRKLAEREHGPARSVTIYDHRGRPKVVVEVTQTKRKR
jgi:hypothetical protein